MNYYKHHIGDYTRDTSHLTMQEDGCYRRMLDLYYTTETALPLDTEILFRKLRARAKGEQKTVTVMLSEFFTRYEDGWRHGRCDREIVAMQNKSDMNRDNGADGLTERWGGPKERARMKRSERLSAARKLATHTPEEWQAVLEACSHTCVACGVKAEELIGGTLCKDHIVPIYQGGSDGIGNLQPMCRECNTGKGRDCTDRRPAGWEKRLADLLDSGAETSAEMSSERDEKRLANGTYAGAGPLPTTHKPLPTTPLPTKPRPSTPKVKTLSAAPTAPTWAAYAAAYSGRYGVEPVRNAKVNGQLSKFLERIPVAEAPGVAGFFVQSNRSLYVSAKHCVDLLLRDAESLRTEWATGNRTTDEGARQADRTQTNANVWGNLIKQAEGESHG